MASVAGKATGRSRFYLGMALALAAVAVGGFMPTYWLQLAPGSFIGPALLHIHGALFTGWVVLLVSQAWLAAHGRMHHHRAWGMAGIALAGAMVAVGITTAIYSLKVELAAGDGDSARAFLVVPLSAMLLFAGFFAAAIANIARPDTHKRLVILATLALVQAAAARIAFVLATGGGPGMRPGLSQPPPPIAVITTSMVLQLFIVAGMIHDRRTIGHVHRAWLIGLAVTTAVIFGRLPLGHTAAFLGFAEWTTHIAD